MSAQVTYYCTREYEYNDVDCPGGGFLSGPACVEVNQANVCFNFEGWSRKYIPQTPTVFSTLEECSMNCG